MKRPMRRFLIASALLLGLSCVTQTLVFAAGNSWFATWAGPARDPGATGSTFPAATTLREPVFATIAGDMVRVKFSNAFGTNTLTIGPASVGIRSTGSSVIPGAVLPLTFGGNATVDIPPRGLVLSDPVQLTVPALTDLTISLFSGSATNALDSSLGCSAATAEICTPWEAAVLRTVRLAPSPSPAVQGAERGTVISSANPLAGNAAVGESATAAINRPMTVAKGPPAMTADCFAAAISAVLLVGAGVVSALLQLAVLEFGSWFSLAFPR